MNETNQNHQPVLALRDNTERPETIAIRTNELIGTDPVKLPPALAQLGKGASQGEESVLANSGREGATLEERLPNPQSLQAKRPAPISQWSCLTRILCAHTIGHKPYAICSFLRTRDERRTGRQVRPAPACRIRVYDETVRDRELCGHDLDVGCIAQLL